MKVQSQCSIRTDVINVFLNSTIICPPKILKEAVSFIRQCQEHQTTIIMNDFSTEENCPLWFNCNLNLIQAEHKLELQ
jgi:hypothetical protein